MGGVRVSDDREEITIIESCTAIKETERALLVTSYSFEGEKWVPKSVIDDDSDVFEMGGTGLLYVKTWWAEKNELL